MHFSVFMYRIFIALIFFSVCLHWPFSLPPICGCFTNRGYFWFTLAPSKAHVVYYTLFGFLNCKWDSILPFIEDLKTNTKDSLLCSKKLTNHETDGQQKSKYVFFMSFAYMFQKRYCRYFLTKKSFFI